MSHKQVTANVRVYVDEEIKEFVELLNTFAGVCTYMSCQGGERKNASIYLYYGTADGALDNTLKKSLALALFAGKLAAAISQVMEETGGHKSALYYLDLSIIWRNDKECPYFLMEMPSSMIAEITDLFYLVKKEFKEFDDSMIRKIRALVSASYLKSWDKTL